jgi:hypothetical protein
MRDLPLLWQRATDEERKDPARELILDASALGGRRLASACGAGVQVVVMVGATGFEPATS